MPPPLAAESREEGSLRIGIVVHGRKSPARLLPGQRRGQRFDLRGHPPPLLPGAHSRQLSPGPALPIVSPSPTLVA